MKQDSQRENHSVFSPVSFVSLSLKLPKRKPPKSGGFVLAFLKKLVRMTMCSTRRTKNVKLLQSFKTNFFKILQYITSLL